jgi:DNA-3-methyladenine glycosylase II
MDIVNPKDIKRLLRMDDVFARIQEQYGSPPSWSRPAGFISLSQIILEQQVSLASAKAHFLKLKGHIKTVTPRKILTLSDEEMRACQISRQKSVYLRALSTAVLDKSLELDKLEQLHHTEVRKQLTAIKGIGDWTTDIYLMFCLQAKDVFPIGDIAVVNTIKEFYEVKKKEEMLELAESWKPLRSLATYFLWHHYLKKRNRS